MRLIFERFKYIFKSHIQARYKNKPTRVTMDVTSQFIFQNLGKTKIEATHSFKFNEEGFVVRHDFSGEHLAVGCNNGKKHIINLADYKVLTTIECPDAIPVTAMRWRPTTQSKTKVLVTTDSQGALTHWHIPSGKKLFSLSEPNNSILCLDYNPAGTRFATAGKDFNVRIYDQTTKSVELTLHGAQWNTKGHSNRIFSVKFIDAHTLISGGWDSVVHIWDLREGRSVRSMYGPHLSGDALDYSDGRILTGSYTNKDQLQIWSFESGKLLQTLPWGSGKDVAYLYTAQFSKLDKNVVLSGSCGTNEVRVYTNQGGNHSLTHRISRLQAGCYSVDSSPTTRQRFAFTDASGALVFLDFSKNL